MLYGGCWAVGHISDTELVHGLVSSAHGAKKAKTHVSRLTAGAEPASVVRCSCSLQGVVQRQSRSDICPAAKHCQLEKPKVCSLSRVLCSCVLGGVFLVLVPLPHPPSFIPLESLQCPCWTSQGLVSFSCLVSLLCLQIRSPFTPCSFSQASAALQSVLVSMASFPRGQS